MREKDMKMEKLYVLCVDDQREVLSSVVRDLTSLKDWTVVEECESAEEAQSLVDELASEGRPLALVICDHIMPGENGVDFLARLTEDARFPHVKKILLTGQATQQDTIAAINRAKIDNYFEKPWETGPLLASARRLLSEYLFDTGLYTKEYQSVVASGVLLERLR